LTPQELQVALQVARGSTNREVAAALFLSTKTIEFHLRNLYRKLGIRSRTELVRIVLSLPSSAADADPVRVHGEHLPLADGGGRDAAADR
jgi:DNA-binding CsgD family transcriptional regulator